MVWHDEDLSHIDVSEGSHGRFQNAVRSAARSVGRHWTRGKLDLPRTPSRQFRWRARLVKDTTEAVMPVAVEPLSDHNGSC
jgi:hypothetical protein